MCVHVICKKCIQQAGAELNHCTANGDSFIKDGLEELDQKVEEIFNQTQGRRTPIQY